MNRPYPASIVSRQGRIALLLLLVGLGSGCGVKRTISDAFGDFSEQLFPMTPSEAVQKAFASYDADERRNAAAMISASPFGGEEKYIRFYRQLLKTEPDPTVQAVLVKAMGEHGEVSDAPVIARYLTEQNKPVFVRWEAAKALQKIHHPEVIVELMQALRQDADSGVRAAAADALGQYPTPAVFQSLIGGLDDAHFGVVLASERSLKTLTGADLGTDGGQWLAWADERSGKLFDDQEVYTWSPYVKPRGLMDKMQFWKKTAPVAPEAPTGLSRDDTPADES